MGCRFGHMNYAPSQWPRPDSQSSGSALSSVSAGRLQSDTVGSMPGFFQLTARWSSPVVSARPQSPEYRPARHNRQRAAPPPPTVYRELSANPASPHHRSVRGDLPVYPVSPDGCATSGSPLPRSCRVLGRQAELLPSAHLGSSTRRAGGRRLASAGSCTGTRPRAPPGRRWAR